VAAAIEIFAPGYPALRSAQAQVQAVMKAEETNFLSTLNLGEAELKKALEKSDGKTLSGDAAFRLYETFGFPLELTKEIAHASGVAVDEPGFKAAQERGAELARASWKGSGEKNLTALVTNAPKTDFLGYDALESRAKVVASAPGLVVLDKTPFYAEGGGQVGDSGDLVAGDGSRVLARVADTQKQSNVFVHVLEGNAVLPVGTEVVAKVDAERRARIAPHHTATHLMNEAMKRVL